MANYYLVERACGPDWDHSRRRREQDGWTEHEAFMDKLTEEGIIVLGGPIGEGEDGNALQIVDLPGEARARRCCSSKASTALGDGDSGPQPDQPDDEHPTVT